jgi:hypothetical protein
MAASMGGTGIFGAVFFDIKVVQHTQKWSDGQENAADHIPVE